MGIFVKQVIYKYRDNPIAKMFVRPFVRLKRRFDEKKRNKLFLSNGQKLLMHLKETLDFNNVFFWLEFGTFLGAYRDHDFIKHDLDLDIGTFYENKGEIYNALSQNGFRLIKEFKVGETGKEGLEQTYSYEDVTIDVFFFHKDEKQMYCNSFSPFDNEHVDMSVFQVKKITVPYNGFSKMIFKDMELNSPADPIAHLQAHYGKNFMIPDAHFDYKKEATNIYWYSRAERVGKLRSWE